MNDKHNLQFFLSHYVNILLLTWIMPVFLFSGCTKEKISPEATLEDFTSYIDKRVPDIMQEYEIPGATIALVKKGRIVWTNAYGFADLEEGRMMTTGHYCRVESISKSVTAWGVMKLVEEGKINLDKPLADYLKSWKLPESQFSKEKVTIRQLLSQQSGMPLGTIGVRYSPNAVIPSLKDHLSQDAVLFQEPGKSFSYSNTGFNLLELLIEEVTGQDFEIYMKENVLLPLDMRHSSFSWNGNFKPEVPNGYDADGKPIPVYVYPDKASGGLFATVDDIASFTIAGMPAFSQKGLEVLNAKSIEKLYTPAVELSGYYQFVFDSYGFGHFIETLPNGLKSVSNGGQGSGWMTHFQFVPQTGDGIVILTNSQRSWPFFGYVLSDWAEWNGFRSVGMGKIVQGIKALWIIIGLLLFLWAWQMHRLVKDIISRNRKLSLLSGKNLGLRLLQFGSSLVLILIVFWAYNQPYFFMFSVFPIISKWLIALILLAALILFLFVLFPGYSNNRNSQREIKKQINTMKNKELFLIKSLHTLIWLFYNVVIFYLLYAVIVGKIDKWVWICIGLIVAEGIVLLVFKWFCPLTLIARKYSDSIKDNFDIFLPNWLAKYTKVIYTSIFGLAILILIYRLISS